MESSTENMVHSTIITNYPKFEEIYIKEEPVEETSLGHEMYENVMQNVKKEECIIDNDNQSDKAIKACDNSITISKDIWNSKNITTNSFCCAECNKSFNRKSGLTQHMKIHTGIKDFECTTCNKLFLKNSHLKEHMAIHSGKKDYKCEICNKGFTQSGSLSKHSKIHSEIREYMCPTCNKSFADKSNLKRHITKIHSEIKDMNCTKCNKLFKRSQNLSYHMKICSGNGNINV